MRMSFMRRILYASQPSFMRRSPLLFPIPVQKRTFPSVASVPAAPVRGKRGVIGHTGSATVEVNDGSVWPDVLGPGMGGPRLLVTKRVAKGLQSLMKTARLELHSVLVTATRGKLAGSAAGEYYYVNPPPGIEVAGDPPVNQYAFPITPRMETWTGDGVVRPGNWDVPYWYVSGDVVDLASDEKWTGISFHPMDLGVGPFAGWNEIQPKKGWRDARYPKPPLGTPEADEQLIEAVCSAHSGTSYEARLGLFDRGEHVVSRLVNHFERETDHYRRQRLAQALAGIIQIGVQVPDRIKPSVAAIEQGG